MYTKPVKPTGKGYIMKVRRLVSAVACAAMLAVNIPAVNIFAESGEVENPTEIVIDGTKANTNETMLYRGAGMVSANNSSRLLLDYKAENPEAYWKILDYLFGDKGVGVTYLKLEMGADINSSSGTEPAVMRTEDEEPDATRGAGYQLAADAKTINPDLALDMLWWSEPLWVSSATDVYAARYKWYKGTLEAAYKTYGLKFDYVSTTQNERGSDTEWIKYLSKTLKSDTDCSYDFSKIKIVSGDEVCTWAIADKMLADKELLDAIDVVGSHYTSRSTENAQKLAYEYGKELWFSEGCTPMNYARGVYRFDENGSGLAGLNGTLDIANRIIMMYPNGKMTMCQFQPAVASFYDGVSYCHKQFILANDPWSGYYFLDSGFFMSLHFSQFMKKGWAFVDGACYADGKNGGDGHAIVESVYSYVTSTDTKTGDYSTVITNTTSEPITYNFTVSNLAKASSDVNIWETRGPNENSDDYDENYFKNVQKITPVEKDGKYTYSVTVKPCSMITLSTLEIEQTEYVNPDESERKILALPYTDDFEYADYPENYLASRGNAPRYTTDQGGAFEVQNINGNNVLMQMITPEIKAKEWGGTPAPTTNFGDDRWFNYSVSADVTFAESDAPDSNYAGVGLRFNMASSGESGYWIRLYEDGKYEFMRNGSALQSGALDSLDASAWTKLKIEAVDATVKCYIADKLVIEYTATGEAAKSAGRASLFSSMNKNCFDNIAVEPVENTQTYITRYDNTDLLCNYTGEWEHETMGSYKYYKRTISTGKEGAVLTVDFEGDGFAFAGTTKRDVKIMVTVDGKVVDEEYTINGAGQRDITYMMSGLEKGKHKVELKVLQGEYRIDSVQVTGEKVYLTSDEKKEENIPPETQKSEVTTADSSSPDTDGADKPKDSQQEFPLIPVLIGAGAVVAAALITGIILFTKRKK